MCKCCKYCVSSSCSAKEGRTVSNDSTGSNTIVDDKTTAGKVKSENINLFAVDDRKAMKTPPTSDILSTIKDTKVISMIRSTDKQAEILRLEAEKEQLQIDALRIQNEKVPTSFILCTQLHIN